MSVTMTELGYVTEDRRCGSCGEPVQGCDGEVTDETVDSNGWRVVLSTTYNLKPCGHAFKRAFGVNAA